MADTLFIFTGSRDEALRCRTLDKEVLQDMMLDDWIAAGTRLKLNDQEYKVLDIVIDEPLTNPSRFAIEEEGIDLGRSGVYTVQVRVRLDV